MLLPRRPPKPEPLVLEDVQEHEAFVEQHVALAQKLGVKTWHKPNQSLAKILIELGIKVYDTAKVERYMDSKGYWGWFPLRQQDKVSPPEERGIERVTPHRHATLYGGMKREQYDKVVPLAVLLRVEQFLEKLPSARFLVAALDTHPDPFLGVLDRDDPNNNRAYIIERWDEPGYRD